MRRLTELRLIRIPSTTRTRCGNLASNRISRERFVVLSVAFEPRSDSVIRLFGAFITATVNMEFTIAVKQAGEQLRLRPDLRQSMIG